MYYEERTVNGNLQFRNTLQGEWKPKKDGRARAIKALWTLSGNDRLAVIRMFCIYCGGPKHSCTCKKGF